MSRFFSRRDTGQLQNIVQQVQPNLATQPQQNQNLGVQQQPNTPVAKEHPISSAIIHKMLELEQDFFNRTFTTDGFSELLGLYSKCVEYYDSIKDPMKTYFMEKIQITVSNSKTLDMLLDMNEKERIVQERQKKHLGDALGVPTDDVELPQVDKSNTYVRRDTMDFIADKIRQQELKKEEERGSNLSFQQLKKKRSQMTNLKFKVREENRKAETGKLISGHLNSAEMLDTLIKDNLSSQADNIKSRLEMRRNLSFQKSVMSRSNFGGYPGAQEDSISSISREFSLLKGREEPMALSSNILDGLNEESVKDTVFNKSADINYTKSQQKIDSQQGNQNVPQNIKVTAFENENSSPTRNPVQHSYSVQILPSSSNDMNPSPEISPIRPLNEKDCEDENSEKKYLIGLKRADDDQISGFTDSRQQEGEEEKSLELDLEDGDEAQRQNESMDELADDLKDLMSQQNDKIESTADVLKTEEENQAANLFLRDEGKIDEKSTLESRDRIMSDIPEEDAEMELEFGRQSMGLENNFINKVKILSDFPELNMELDDVYQDMEKDAPEFGRKIDSDPDNTGAV